MEGEDLLCEEVGSAIPADIVKRVESVGDTRNGLGDMR